MTTRWKELVTLAEELDAACKSQSPLDLEKARKLARAVIDLPHAPGSADQPEHHEPRRSN